MCIYNIYLNNILASIYTHNYFNNNFILATICTLCEVPESNTIDSGAIQINCIIIIIIIIYITQNGCRQHVALWPIHMTILTTKYL